MDVMLMQDGASTGTPPSTMAGGEGEDRYVFWRIA